MNIRGPVLLGAIIAATMLDNHGSALGAVRLTPPPSAPIAAQQQLAPWRPLPYSSAFIDAQAQSAPAIGGLICGNAPCAFQNVFASSGPFPINDAPIASNPNNPKQLLTAGIDFNCTNQSVQGYFASTDGGSSWTGTCGGLPVGEQRGLGDPVVGYDLSGTAYRGGLDSIYRLFRSVIVIDHSYDGGTTWSAPVIAVTPFFNGGFSDEPWLKVDTTRSSPRRNTLYVSATQFQRTTLDSAITVSRSIDHGKTWKTSLVTKSVEPFINQFSDIATGRDGTVYVSWLRCTLTGPTGDCGGTTAQLLIARSTDGAKTWSAPYLIESVQLTPDVCEGFYGCIPKSKEPLSEVPSIAVDDSAGAKLGTLYAIAYSFNRYTSVQITKSLDGGSTWATPKAISSSTNQHDQFFPWVSVSANGVVGASWMDRRNDPSNVSYEAYGAYSNNGGATFPNLQLASEPSNPKDDGDNGHFLGVHCMGNTFEGDSLYASWTDTRSGTAQDVVGGFRLR